MYIDKQLVFSENQAITAAGASQNVIDLGATDCSALRMEILCRVTESFDKGVLTIALQTSDAQDFSLCVNLPVNQTLALAELGQGAEILRTALPEGCKRYVRLYYTVSGTPPTTGRITAGLVLDRQTL